MAVALLVWFLLAPVLALIIGASIRLSDHGSEDAAVDRPCQRSDEDVEDVEELAAVS